MEINKLNEILENHKKWLLDRTQGMKANLSNTNLSNMDLSNTDLRYADLSNANLSNTDLSNMDLSNTDLSNTDLRFANLSNANLSNTDLRYADLRYANLRYANLSNANLNGIIININTIGVSLVCPEEGSFIGYKKANQKIVKLQITEKAQRSSATTRKCRCSEALVLSIIDIDGCSYDSVPSDYNNKFIYEVGKIVKVDDFDTNRWNECSKGIHFFIDKQDAINYCS